jgi:hypothetical protein
MAKPSGRYCALHVAERAAAASLEKLALYERLVATNPNIERIEDVFRQQLRIRRFPQTEAHHAQEEGLTEK